MGLHYTVRVFRDDTQTEVIHLDDMLDACDRLVDIADVMSHDETLPANLRGMVDSHAAGLIRLCYDRILRVDEEHFVRFTQPGMPMIRLVVARHADIPGAPTPTLIDNLTGQPA